MPRPKTWKLKTTDSHGRAVTKTVNIQLDLAGFKDCAVFPYLLMAANPHLSTRDIQDVASSFGDHQWRSETWIKTRRWMCSVDPTPVQESADGLDEQAQRILQKNPRMSARRIAAVLEANGILRTLQWVYRSRFG
jgi:hypothetical protein